MPQTAKRDRHDLATQDVHRTDFIHTSFHSYITVRHNSCDCETGTQLGVPLLLGHRRRLRKRRVAAGRLGAGASKVLRYLVRGDVDLKGSERPRAADDGDLLARLGRDERLEERPRASDPSRGIDDQNRRIELWVIIHGDLTISL